MRFKGEHHRGIWAGWRKEFDAITKSTDPGFDIAEGMPGEYMVAILTFAVLWAEKMEKMMAGGASVNFHVKVADIAREAERWALDKEGNGITGYQYGIAAWMLSEVWEHGEALRRWHNLKTQIGTEGEEANEKGTVLNPALLTISSPEQPSE